MSTSMSAPPRSSTGIPLPEGLSRDRDDRVIAGVCAGVARWLGVDPTIVRIAVVLLGFANGVGLLVYAVAAVVLPEDAPGDVGDPAAAEAPAPGTSPHHQNVEHALALGCITLGVLLLVRWVSPFFPDHVVWPATVAAGGLGLVWSRAGEADRARWRETVSRLPGDPLAALSGRGLWLRLHGGAILLIAGIGWFIAANSTFAGLGQIGMAILATALGLAVLLGPWISGLVRQLRTERHERIRSEERADMAAHLHDSVLQTLALIQRHADSPQQTRSLARRQERELRGWLFDARTPGDAPATLAAALDRLSDDIESDHDVTVDVVVVGDHPFDERLEALVAALREAAVNAARHSGEPEVSVYVELADGEVEAYVRDRGKGFDRALVDRDRRGIADSIIGRMARHGGSAKVRSTPGEGTEVMLHLPLDRDRKERDR
ncbi:MAG TPA: PspC domain-containing protein, partial [Acidimicrobiales bacterium]|nr:PspC domain-containing protein [Acidimicrobiales bacterium]